MSRFLTEKLARLKAYVPGEQPKGKRYVKLNTNESPYPPPSCVIEAVNGNELEDLRLYSDPECSNLKTKLADLYGVLQKNVFLSNGSDEILNFAFMAYSDRGVIFPDITYGFYSVFADLYDAEAEIVPLNEDFTINIDAFCGKNKLVVIANPNAPTGIALDLAQIEKIISSNPQGIVIIDEAYVDFGAQSAYKLTEKYDNLLVVGTYSKSRSMAGARLGFGFANAEIIADLERIKYSTNPYNINRMTMAAGIGMLEDEEYTINNCKQIIKNREYTQDALKALGFEQTPSATNFVFAKHKDIGGEKLYLELKKRGILVRHFGSERICEYNRITIGTREQMERLIDAIGNIIKENAYEK